MPRGGYFGPPLTMLDAQTRRVIIDRAQDLNISIEDIMASHKRDRRLSSLRHRCWVAAYLAGGTISSIARVCKVHRASVRYGIRS